MSLILPKLAAGADKLCLLGEECLRMRDTQGNPRSSRRGGAQTFEDVLLFIGLEHVILFSNLVRDDRCMSLFMENIYY